MDLLSVLRKLRHTVCYYVPAICTPLFQWLFGISHDSRSLREIRMVFIVTVVRAIFNDPTPVPMLKEQQDSLVEAQVPGCMWICPDTLPIPVQHNLNEVVKEAAAALSSKTGDIPEAKVVPVAGEWVGHRSRPQPSHNGTDNIMSYDQTYGHLLNETKSEVVMIYLHGGQFYLRNPAARRDIVHALAERTGGRVFSMAYRLSPQNMFPAAILDLLVVYLSLLYPLPGSRHEAVSATRICICGDSSGGSLAIAFLQLLLQLRRQESTGDILVRWNGTLVPLPFPAAVCAHSAYLDLARSLPSEETNLKYDIIPSAALPPAPEERYLPDNIWPSVPKRHHVYAPTSLLTHPLVSPVTAADWRNCPTKVWISVGRECLLDGNVVLAKNMDAQGLDISLEIYQDMPHDFLVLFQSTAWGQECLDSWASFVKDAAAQRQAIRPSKGQIRAAVFLVANANRRSISLHGLEPKRTREEVVSGMLAKIESWGTP